DCGAHAHGGRDDRRPLDQRGQRDNPETQGYYHADPGRKHHVTSACRGAAVNGVSTTSASAASTLGRTVRKTAPPDPARPAEPHNVAMLVGRKPELRPAQD